VAKTIFWGKNTVCLLPLLLTGVPLSGRVISWVGKRSLELLQCKAFQPQIMLGVRSIEVRPYHGM